ncbi:hypothetical protein Patl1_11698 [Pistacia atlantica]|uniref:Uncharacterized protein n=1 Tax=Pistacia atlantica TaxID=434234 RepID=A0ACC1A5P9_9ROSI|nr:hypothetical protein Patl1_11698 [Pistacia atlantica]
MQLAWRTIILLSNVIVPRKWLNLPHHGAECIYTGHRRSDSRRTSGFAISDKFRGWPQCTFWASPKGAWKP